MRWWMGLAALALYGQSPRGEWTTYGHNAAGWRYSDLTQITASNVAHAAAGVDVPERRERQV